MNLTVVQTTRDNFDVYLDNEPVKCDHTGSRLLLKDTYRESGYGIFTKQLNSSIFFYRYIEQTETSSMSIKCKVYFTQDWTNSENPAQALKDRLNQVENAFQDKTNTDTIWTVKGSLEHPSIQVERDNKTGEFLVGIRAFSLMYSIDGTTSELLTEYTCTNSIGIFGFNESTFYKNSNSLEQRTVDFGKKPWYLYPNPAVELGRRVKLVKDSFKVPMRNKIEGKTKATLKTVRLGTMKKIQKVELEGHTLSVIQSLKDGNTQVSVELDGKIAGYGLNNELELYRFSRFLTNTCYEDGYGIFTKSIIKPIRFYRYKDTTKKATTSIEISFPTDWETADSPLQALLLRIENVKQAFASCTKKIITWTVDIDA